MATRIPTSSPQSASLSADLPSGLRPMYPGQQLLALVVNPLGLLEQAAKHGDVVRLATGPQPAFLLTNPEDIQNVLITRQRNFIKSPLLQRMRAFLGDGLLTSEGPLHLRQRRLIQPVFRHQRVVEYGSIMIGHAGQLSERWQDGATLDIHSEMMHLTMAVVGQALFGVNVEGEAAEIGQAISILLHGSRRLRLPFWKQMMALPLPGNRRLVEAGQRLNRLIERMIAERRAAIERGEGEKYADLLTMLLEARDVDGDGQGMSDRLVRDEAMTLFLAGHETTANALTWTWYLLSQNPQVEETLRAELSGVLGNRQPTPEDAERLPYTRMVLKESMRLYPPSWTISRQALSDFPLGNYVLPAGSILLMSQWVTHHDPRFYPDPLRFDPQRWSAEAAASRPRFAYFPFGGGPRVCIGEPFAWMEGILVLATLAQRWRLRLDPAQRVALLPQVTLRPKYGMRMKLHRL